MPTDEDAFLAGIPAASNPEEGFVGSVDDPGGGLPPDGYGVYERPVAAGIRRRGLPARAARGVDLGWLRQQLARGRPVIVWATSALDAPQAVVLQDPAGRSFAAARGEHTFVAFGYDGGRLLLLDPATGRVKEVAAPRFDASWAVLGRRAVVVELDPPGVATP